MLIMMKTIVDGDKPAHTDYDIPPSIDITYRGPIADAISQDSPLPADCDIAIEDRTVLVPLCQSPSDLPIAMYEILPRCDFLCVLLYKLSCSTYWKITKNQC